MGPTRFDELLQSLSAFPSRRAAMRLLGGLVLGGPLALGTWAASAHTTLKRCKKIEDKTKRKKCVKKARKHNAQHAADTVPECRRPEDCPAPQEPCRVASCSGGRCGIEPLSGGSITCGIGACQRTVAQCSNGEQQQCVPGAPSSEICNGIDDDCDGLIDVGAPPCPVGQRCERGGCCKVEGFDTEHACTSNTECCSENCATHAFGTTCRPAGCLPAGGDCSAGPSACCSLSCSGPTCQ